MLLPYINPGVREPGGWQVKATGNYHTCTCVFPNKAIAVVHVLGARTQNEAHSFVQSVWYPCLYAVSDGDLTNGFVEPFYLRLKPERNNITNGY